MTTTIGEAWRQARRHIDTLDARLLVEHLAPCTHAELLAYPERVLSTEQIRRLDSLVERRANGEPLAYLLGTTRFYGLDFRVTPAVLVPRPETGLLVELGLERLRALSAARAVDLGTGAGILAVTLARYCPWAMVNAVDLSPPAIEVARENALRHQVKIRFLVGDWYAPLAGSRFDLIVANPPYVAEGDPHLRQGGLPFEPRMALTDGVIGGDGLACLRTIIAGARAHLLPGGWLLLEHGYDQAASVRRLLSDNGLSDVASWQDLCGIERVSGGRWR